MTADGEVEAAAGEVTAEGMLFCPRGMLSTVICYYFVMKT